MTRGQSIALAELQQKSLQQIQFETAQTWAYRAWAAKQLGLTRDYDSYRDEALEHAALSERDDTLSYVRSIMDDT